jgi:hypothetical protein
MIEDLRSLRQEAARLRRLAEIRMTGSYRADLVLLEVADRIDEHVDRLTKVAEIPAEPP